METIPKVDIEALLLESQAVRQEAGRLLQEFRLVERLRPYGDVQVTGSYRWDLMLFGTGFGAGSGDLDFYVVNPEITLEIALQAFTDFLRSGEFLRFGFIDTMRRPAPWLDLAGYYLGMTREIYDRNWRVEVWFVPSLASDQQWISERMTDDARRTILKLKHLRRTGHLNVPSFDLYRAVLLGGAREPEDVTAWLAPRDPLPVV
jgi:hypothetical protein